MIENITLILDLDGVLITTPAWKSDEIDSDGYSKFNQYCVNNLNKLLSLNNFDIWLSSARRVNKSLQDFNIIFNNRGINIDIKGFLPIYQNCNSRKDNILMFLDEFKPNEYIIIDDDKSLNSLEKKIKDYVILTELMIGFDKEQLENAIKKLKLYD